MRISARQFAITSKRPTRKLIKVELDNLKKLDVVVKQYRLDLFWISRLRFVEEGEKLPIYREEYDKRIAMPPIALVDNSSISSFDRGDTLDILDGNRRTLSAVDAGHPLIWGLYLVKWNFR